MIIFGLTLSILQIVLSIVFLLAFLIQLIFYLIVYRKVGNNSSIKNKKTLFEPVSVIICAKNEEDNIQKNLPLILEQDFPNFEVIVVNDCSEDNTGIYLERLASQYSNLHISTIKADEKFTHGKKLALTVGIKAAKNDIILLTDADCKPESKNWIRHFQQKFTGNIEVVLGYGSYSRRSGFLDKLIRFDTFWIALNYFGLALSKHPYMGVGRNLAYRKSLFFKNRGFASHNHIQSGDDDLFVNEVANKTNTAICIEKESFTSSTPKTSFRKWFYQKKRHNTTWPKYKFVHKMLLATELLSRFFFYLTLGILLAINFYPVIILSVFLLRAIIQLFSVKKALNRLNEKDLLLFSLLFDIILPIISMFITISNLLSKRKKNKWK